MSKKPKKPEKNFKYTVQHELPKLGKTKEVWDLATLYYRSENDPQIEKDIQTAEKAYKKFAKTYRNSDFTTSVQTLKKALTDLEALTAMPERRKPGRYFSFRHVLNANDSVAEKRLALLSDRLTKTGNELLFFEIELGAVPKEQQKVFLTAPELQQFRYYLERVFLEAKHTLTEAEEKILNLKSGPSSGMWVAATEKILSNRSVTYKGKTIPVNEALERLDLLPSKEKPKFWSLIVAEMEQLSEFAEAELNAVMTDKKIEDELRGYKKPYSATVEAYEDDLKSVEALVEAVSGKGFKLSQKFYQLKAAYTGVKQLDYSQKYDSIGTATSIPYAQAVEICRDVFYGLKDTYGEVFDSMLERGQIDVYPKAGKRGGAFMSDSVNLPTHVFLNHTDDARSLQTLAHEMGHAIHGERSKTQTPFYQGHSITTAETASTLFENFVFRAVYEQANEADKRVMLHQKIAQNIATIQRQIACFNYELELNNRVRTEGSLTREELRSMMVRHMEAYLGKSVKVNPSDGYIYVYWSHIRYGFYVYTYTFGILMSNLMAARYHEDPGYIKEIDTFLTSGSSASVPDIFKSIGINTKQLSTFELGLKELEDDISTFATLVKPKK